MHMNNQPEPVVLDLAQLPREKIGPFFILGVDKDASKEQSEASWARRLIGARKNQLSVSLEDINWAKEIVADAERRIKADVTSLNLDLLDGSLRKIARRFSNGQGGPRPTWRPLDVDKPPQTWDAPVDLPAWQEVRDSIVLPVIPEEVPAIRSLLAHFVGGGLHRR